MQNNASATHRGDLIAAAQDWLSHRALNSAVPLAEGVAELRFRCPDAAPSDEALELLLVELALKRGLAICFDRRQEHRRGSLAAAPTASSQEPVKGRDRSGGQAAGRPATG